MNSAQNSFEEVQLDDNQEKPTPYLDTLPEWEVIFTLIVSLICFLFCILYAFQIPEIYNNDLYSFVPDVSSPGHMIEAYYSISHLSGGDMQLYFQRKSTEDELHLQFDQEKIIAYDSDEDTKSTKHVKQIDVVFERGSTNSNILPLFTFTPESPNAKYFKGTSRINGNFSGISYIFVNTTFFDMTSLSYEKAARFYSSCISFLVLLINIISGITWNDKVVIASTALGLLVWLDKWINPLYHGVFRYHLIEQFLIQDKKKLAISVIAATSIFDMLFKYFKDHSDYNEHIALEYVNLIISIVYFGASIAFVLKQAIQKAERLELFLITILAIDSILSFVTSIFYAANNRTEAPLIIDDCFVGLFSSLLILMLRGSNSVEYSMVDLEDNEKDIDEPLILSECSEDNSIQ